MAAPEDLIIPPPPVKLLDYPGAIGGTLLLVVTVALLFATSRFDPTKGVLTISLMVVSTFIALVIYSSRVTVPTDEVTSAVVGGLVAAFGSVIGYWIGRGRNGG